MNPFQYLAFYFHYAVRSLRREGIRTILAGLSITFGVLSLVSMQLLSSTLMHGAMFNEQIQYGGDAQIQAADWGQSLSENDLAQIEAWQKDDLIRSFTPISRGSAQYFRTTKSGRVAFVMNAVGFDPESYPLVGSLVLREPAQTTPAAVLVHPTDVLITRDLADSLGLHIGDPLVIGGGDAATTQLMIAGIVASTPNQFGKAIFYSLETARLLENREDVVTSVSIMWGGAPDAEKTLVDSSLAVFVARSRDESVTVSDSNNLFDMMLKGAGVLGLLVGGLGVSNTLQVILARRKLEIAMLKTLGCQRHTLLTMIGLETGLLGLISSIVGALAGAFVAGKLLEMLANAGVFMLDWSPDRMTLLGGLLAGTCTAVVFGMQAILASSATRPIELLRDLPVKTPMNVVIGRAALFGVLIVIFGALVGLVLGSMLDGVLYVLVGGAFLILLRGVFWVALWVILKLPLPAIPMLKLARANLNRRKLQSSLIVIALFAGVFSMSFAALIIYNAQERITEMRPSDAGYNLMVFTSADALNSVTGHLVLEGANDFYTRSLVNGMLNNEAVQIEGRAASELAVDITLNSEWNGADDTVLLSDEYASTYAVGDTISLQAQSDAALTVAGFYTASGDYNTNVSSLQPASDVIVSPETALKLGGETIQVQVVADVPVERLNATTDALGAALPDALIFSKSDLTNLMISTFQSLFSFAVTVASLAFVAGAVLIANSAGLTVVERRRDIGVFKAVGYTSSHVLRLLVSEYGLLGLLAGIFGIVAVSIAITIINITQPGARMVIEPLIVTAMLLLSIGLAVVSAALIAWQPTRVRPLDVLRYE
jgi:putative ABC transport system permease protein